MLNGNEITLKSFENSTIGFDPPLACFCYFSTPMVGNPWNKRGNKFALLWGEAQLVFALFAYYKKNSGLKVNYS